MEEGLSQFKLCAKDTFLKKGGELVCEKCDINGVCEGGYIPIYPKEKYWRESKDDYRFVYCRKKGDVCMGNDTCKKGYTGLLCENCDSLNDYAPAGESC